jgi:hypothetical protein
MFVLCPHCQFLVGLEPGSASPPERCPRCRQLLQAVPEPEPASTPVESLPPPPAIEPLVPDAPLADVTTVADATEPAPEPATGDIAMADRVATVDPGTAAIAGELPVAPDHGAVEGEVAASAPTRDSPAVVVAAKPAARSRRSRAGWPSVTARRWIMPAGIPLLLILLVVQSLLSDRARLAADARWRPVVAAACSVLGCDLPPWREPEAFTLLDRDVRPDPSRPGVLRVTAVFRNDARWPQPMPPLLLTLSDADGRIAGERLFTPAEYLAGAPHTRLELASGQSAHVALDVVEPPQGVVAFTFDLR